MVADFAAHSGHVVSLTTSAGLTDELRQLGRIEARDNKVFPRQGPRSVEEWLLAGCFGLRPYVLEILQTTVVKAPPKD